MTGMMLRDPITIFRVLFQIGPKVLLGWFAHYAMLGVYTVLHHTLGKLITAHSKNFRLRRLAQAWCYGSSSDYVYVPVATPAAPKPYVVPTQQTAPAPASVEIGGDGETLLTTWVHDGRDTNAREHAHAAGMSGNGHHAPHAAHAHAQAQHGYAQAHVDCSVPGNAGAPECSPWPRAATA